MNVERSRIDRKVDQLMDRIVEAGSLALVAVYERRVPGLEQREADVNENITSCGRPLADVDNSFRTALTFLVNSCKLWTSERREDQRTVLRLAFAGKMP
jgi:hypothetical protein